LLNHIALSFDWYQELFRPEAQQYASTVPILSVLAGIKLGVFHAAELGLEENKKLSELTDVCS
jgi:hypothetical protein